MFVFCSLYLCVSPSSWEKVEKCTSTFQLMEDRLEAAERRLLVASRRRMNLRLFIPRHQPEEEQESTREEENPSIISPNQPSEEQQDPLMQQQNLPQSSNNFPIAPPPIPSRDLEEDTRRLGRGRALMRYLERERQMRLQIARYHPLQSSPPPLSFMRRSMTAMRAFSFRPPSNYQVGEICKNKMR